MDWLRKILEAHVNEEGVLDLEAAEAEIRKEFPKQAVVKSQYNDKAKEAADAKKELDELKGETTNVADLSKQLQAAKDELQSFKSRTQIDNALRKAGAAEEDLDYLAFKLEKEGALEFEENGDITGLADKVTELQKSFEKFFAPAEDKEGNTEDKKAEDKTPAGYKVIDNKLDSGKNPDPEAAMLAELEQVMGLSPATDTKE